MIEPIRYSAFVSPELPKGRIDAQWAHIAAERPTPRRARHVAIPAFGVLAVVCALGVVWWPRETRSSNESVWEGSVVASDDAPVGMTLAEGTHIKVEPRSEVKLLRSSSSAVQVRLTRGSARFEVAKKRSRRFAVNVGDIEVVVTGTQFRVLRKAALPGDRVNVEVEEGSVEVHHGDHVVTLRAGEQWSTLVPHDASLDEVILPLKQVAPVRSKASTPPPAEDGEALDEADDDEGASLEMDDGDETGARTKDPRSAKRRRRVREVQSAAEMFDHANLARRAGRLEDAVETYGDLVARYPRDRRASLAAFELGRIRMDSLRDVEGAVHALERALKLDAHGAFAEDALARLVLAEEALGDRQACGRARARYLSRYPDGVHAQHVAERCGP